MKTNIITVYETIEKPKRLLVTVEDRQSRKIRYAGDLDSLMAEGETAQDLMCRLYYAGSGEVSVSDWKGNVLDQPKEEQDAFFKAINAESTKVIARDGQLFPDRMNTKALEVVGAGSAMQLPARTVLELIRRLDGRNDPHKEESMQTLLYDLLERLTFNLGPACLFQCLADAGIKTSLSENRFTPESEEFEWLLHEAAVKVQKINPVGFAELAAEKLESAGQE